MKVTRLKQKKKKNKEELRAWDQDLAQGRLRRAHSVALASPEAAPESGRLIAELLAKRLFLTAAQGVTTIPTPPDVLPPMKAHGTMNSFQPLSETVYTSHPGQ